MKCIRCGKDMGESKVCNNCGYDISIDNRVKRILKVKPDMSEHQNPTDLLDYPILSFIVGIIGIMIPIYFFSFLALKLSQKPAKPSYEPFQNLGKILAYVGFTVSTGLVLFLFYLLFS